MQRVGGKRGTGGNISETMDGGIPEVEETEEEEAEAEIEMGGQSEEEDEDVSASLFSCLFVSTRLTFNTIFFAARLNS